MAGQYQLLLLTVPVVQLSMLVVVHYQCTGSVNHTTLIISVQDCYHGLYMCHLFLILLVSMMCVCCCLLASDLCCLHYELAFPLSFPLSLPRFIIRRGVFLTELTSQMEQVLVLVGGQLNRSNTMMRIMIIK